MKETSRIGHYKHSTNTLTIHWAPDRFDLLSNRGLWTSVKYRGRDRERDHSFDLSYLSSLVRTFTYFICHASLTFVGTTRNNAVQNRATEVAMIRHHYYYFYIIVCLFVYGCM